MDQKSVTSTVGTEGRGRGRGRGGERCLTRKNDPKSELESEDHHDWKDEGTEVGVDVSQCEVDIHDSIYSEGHGSVIGAHETA